MAKGWLKPMIEPGDIAEFDGVYAATPL